MAGAVSFGFLVFAFVVAPITFILHRASRKGGEGTKGTLPLAYQGKVSLVESPWGTKSVTYFAHQEGWKFGLCSFNLSNNREIPSLFVAKT